MNDFGWAVGLMLVFGTFIVVAVAAHVVDGDRKDLKRLRKLEAARADWNASVIETQCFYKQESGVNE